MSSRRLTDLMHRNQEDFDDILNSLTFSSTAEDDVGGLDAALQKFAEQKAKASMRRRGPVQICYLCVSSSIRRRRLVLNRPMFCI